MLHLELSTQPRFETGGMLLSPILFIQLYKTRRLRREYSTCIGDIMSVGRRRNQGKLRIVHIALYQIGQMLLSPIISFKRIKLGD